MEVCLSQLSVRSSLNPTPSVTDVLGSNIPSISIATWIILLAGTLAQRHNRISPLPDYLA
jgi:hypothetical protein